MNNNELYHYGVPGMRWGVRKSTKRMSSDAAEASRLKKKKVSEMSNDEIQKLNRRSELEQQHKRLNPSKIAKGLLIAGAIATALGTINKLYKTGQESAKLGKEISTKYKNTKMKKERHGKYLQALGKDAVIKRKDLKVSKVFTKAKNEVSKQKIKIDLSNHKKFKFNPVKRR